ncbi:MAG: cobalamin-binding protein [Planctomycetes bacterium]|nr:cobalamin-binding protein [Planctomycetota bacterium]
MRIVSLISSATEIVCALGLEDALVGRSHECDHPASVARLPVCTAPKFAVDGSSAEIDRLVRDTLRESTSVYHVDGDRLRELKPDVIITQTQCEVCAVSRRDVERVLSESFPGNPRVVAQEPNTLADVWQDILRIAEALDVAIRGRELVEQLRGRLEALAVTTATLFHPGIACLEWLDPPMAAGNWVPELVASAGGVNLLGETGKHSATLSWDTVRGLDPAVLVAMPCGFDLERTRREMTCLDRRPGWCVMRAVQSGRVYAMDGNQFFNRPGPRLVESAEILAEILHPDVVNFGHRGGGWLEYGVAP